MYKVFKEEYHIDLVSRCNGYNEAQQKRKDELSIIKYAEKFNHIENLYKVAGKLYETDIKKVLKDIWNTVK
jgi:hypothetical protein